ncbi:hypothetical protein DFJ73DRAFT_494291 [Zopfochytrium polystomum]|nr:hypothetical protein DFJ73DRAFT_494291 [Zopfochytrium polystomum]
MLFSPKRKCFFTRFEKLLPVNQIQLQFCRIISSHPGAAWELPIRSLLAVFLDNPPTRDSAPRIDHLDAEISSRSPNPTTTTPGLITKFGRLEAADGVSRIQEILVQDGKSTARQGVGALTMADWLRKVFQLDEETMDKAIAQVKAICNDRIAFNELERYLEQLENADVPSAPSSDWEKQEVYNAWRDKEILIMMAFRMSYLARMPGLKKVKAF